MKIVSYQGGFGRLEDKFIVPMGDSLISYLESRQAEDGQQIPMDAVTLTAPVTNPSKIILVGINFEGHAQEVDDFGGLFPKGFRGFITFSKGPNSIIGPTDTIRVPPGCTNVDPEGELAVIIGKRASRVSAEEAHDYVFGYTCCNDLADRNINFSPGGLFMAKAIDTFLPLGPYIVTADEIDDVQNLRLRMWVDDEQRQDVNTSEMLHSVAESISRISATMTLEPGDVICMGMSAGVGFARKPPVYLEDGQTVTVEIEQVGILKNSIHFE